MVLSSVVLLAIGGITLWFTRDVPNPEPDTVLVLSLLRIMFPYMVCICMVALAMAVLNSCDHYMTSAATPTILNIIWILTLLFACPQFGDTLDAQIHGVAWGVLFAGVVQVLLQLPALARQGYRPSFTFRWSDERSRRVLVLMAPVALGLGITQVNVMVDRLLAMHVADWAPAAINYADRLIYLPLGIFATAMGTVLLPTFSRQNVQDDAGAVLQTLNNSLRHLMLIMIPASVGLFVLATPIVQLVYMWPDKAFDSYSAMLTGRALMLYAPGLLVFSLYKVVTPAFYAMQDTKTPVIVAAWVVGINLSVNMLIVFTDVIDQEWKHAALAGSTVFSSLISSVVLASILHRRIGNPDWGRIVGSMGRALLCACQMGVVAAAVYSALPGGDKPSQALAIGAAIAAGVIVYFVLCLGLCRAELREIRQGLRRKQT